MPELHYDPEFGVSILNETTVDNSAVFRALQEQEPEVAQMVRWSFDTKPTGQARHGSIINRDRYVTPPRIFDQFQTAYDAVRSDDVDGRDGLSQPLDAPRPFGSTPGASRR